MILISASLSAVFLTFTMWFCDLSLELDLRGILLSIFAFLLVLYFLQKKDPPNFPPGPPALPLFGNVFNIEAKQPHIYLTKVRWQLQQELLSSSSLDPETVLNSYRMSKGEN